MYRVWNIWVTATLAAIIVAASGIAVASDNFAKISLPRGVSIELPKNWVVLSGNQRITLDSAVESSLDLSGIEQEGSEFPFAANYYDDEGYTIGILNIRYYPQLELTQADAQAATNLDISELDAGIKENILKSIKVFGMKVTSWGGTQKTSINGITTFLTEYRRDSLKGTGEFRVRLVRVLSGYKSFTLTVSYHEATALLMKPITDRIISSLNLEGVKKISSVNATLPGTTGFQSTSIMADLYGEQWGLVFFLSFLFTWGVGLAPSLLIRFVFMRRPIAKGWAIGVSVALFFVLVVLSTAMGSKSKSHGVLGLIAFVSYAILRKGAKKQVEVAHKRSKKEKNNQGKALFPANDQLKQGVASNTQNMITKGRTTQLQKGIPSEHTIENKVISKEKAILEELRNESILTSNEFIEKMAVVEAREEAKRFEKLLCSITEPFINKISELKNAGLLNEQEYEQKKRKIIEKHRAELLDEQEQKQKKLAMIKNIISKDDYQAMNAQAFDYLDIIDKKKKLGLIKTHDEETNEIFRLQEIHQELVECNEICFNCNAFRKPSDEKCSACGQIFNKE